jgi:hypothetical protein
MAKGPNDRRRSRVRSVMIGLAVLCVTVVAAVFIARLTPLLVFAHYRAMGLAVIESMGKRRPEIVAPRAWETATAWASIAYANVCTQDAVSIAEMKRLVSDLEAKSKEDVDLSTWTWVWERLEALEPEGQRYYTKFWPEYSQDLAYAQATDESLPTLEGFRQLHYLDLRGTSVTDAGLVHLKKAEKLESLTLSAGVTDAGMAHLSGLTNLRCLSLTGTKVTDSGLEQIAGLPQLETLYVADTQITDGGASHFQERFPKCKIQR